MTKPRRRVLTTREVADAAVKARESLNVARQLATGASELLPVAENGGPPLLTRKRLDCEARLTRAQMALTWVQHAEDQVRHMRVVLTRMIEELEKEAAWH